ncbi:unnamed protein product, partial [Darwinula stevensoni]
MRNHVRSFSLAFRPNDQSYSRDFSLEGVKPGGCQIQVLDRVKRNSNNIAKLFIALGDYSRRVFVSSEKTLSMDIGESEGQWLPSLRTIPSCQAFHRECKRKTYCYAIRASYAIKYIYEECLKSLIEMPLFVVVDDKKRKKVLINFLASPRHSFPLLFLDKKGKFRGNVSQESFYSLVIVTEEEMMGCHLKNVMVILDSPESQWKNYARLIAAPVDNKIVVIEEEDLNIGKFSRFMDGKWKVRNVSINEDINEMLEKGNANIGHKIDSDPEHRFPIKSYPRMVMNDSGNEENVDDVENMLESWLTGIFGYPGSGKSRRVDILIRIVSKRQGRVLLLLCGSALSRELYRQRWINVTNVDVVNYDSDKIASLKTIIDCRTVKQAKKKAEMSDRLFVIVEDCPVNRHLENELEDVVKRLKEEMVSLIITFKPHMKGSSRFSVDRIMNVFKGNSDCSLVVLQSQRINMQLLRHIQRNETVTALKLGSKSLPTSSMPAAIVLGPPVQYMNCEYMCERLHGGYICKKSVLCVQISKKLASALSFCLKLALEANKAGDIHILVSDEALLNSFKKGLLCHDPNITISHPKDFRGCETSVIISVNVGDEWMLEVISRSRTHLIIIDNIRQHQDLWRTMMEEGQVEAWNVTIPPEGPFLDDARKNFLKADERGKFLR